MRLLICIAIFWIQAPLVASAEWYESAGNKWRHVSDVACDVMTSALTGWFTAPPPYKVVGNSAIAKLYAEVSATQRMLIAGNALTGQRPREVHELTRAEGSTLGGAYEQVANARVPFIVNMGMVPFPSGGGAALTLLDALLSQSMNQIKITYTIFRTIE